MNAICLCDSADELSSAAFDLFCVADIISGRRLICWFITTFLAGHTWCNLQLYQSDSVLSCEVTPCEARMKERTEEQKEEEERALCGSRARRKWIGWEVGGDFKLEEVGCGGVGVLRPLALTRRAWLRAQMSQRRPLASIRREGHSVQESGAVTLGWKRSTAKSPPCEKQTNCSSW